MSYLDEARVSVPQDQALAVGHRACSMLQSGTAEGTVVSAVWAASTQDSQAMVSSAHVNLCPDS